MTSEGISALVGLAIDAGSQLIKMIIDAITKNDDESWKKLDDILPKDFKLKLALLRGEEKARQAIKDALENKP